MAEKQYAQSVIGRLAIGILAIEGSAALAAPLPKMDKPAHQTRISYRVTAQDKVLRELDMHGKARHNIDETSRMLNNVEVLTPSQERRLLQDVAAIPNVGPNYGPSHPRGSTEVLEAARDRIFNLEEAALRFGPEVPTQRSLAREEALAAAADALRKNVSRDLGQQSTGYVSLWNYTR